MPCTTKSPKIVEVRPAGRDHQVVSLKGGKGGYRKQPCGGCPWRKDQTGEFPAEAFKHSASTSYDMAQNTFACHESGQRRPATCAGFLMRGADNNLAVRMKYSRGEYDFDAISDGGHDLHDSYRDMAIANGVPANDPVLAPCR